MNTFIICGIVWLVSGIINALIYLYDAIYWRKQVDIGDIYVCVFITLMGTFGLFMTIKEHYNITLDKVIWKAKE